MVVVGAGHCGGRAVQALRDLGWTGALHLIGDESHAPYERPPLSKDLLTGQREAGACALMSEADWDALGVQRHVAQAVKLDTQARTLTLSSGELLPYRSLLMATGGRARSLTLPGADLPGVLVLRTLADAQALAPRLAAGQRLAVIGGSFIGLEVAASARKMECEVTLVEGASRLMGRAVPEALAERALQLHRARGTRVLLGVSPTRIERTAQGLGLFLADGSSVQADTLVVGIGIEPGVALAREAGLAVQRGVVVNARLQTSDPAVFAAGDVAEFPSAMSGELIRQETWHNAETQARVVAQNMLGGQASYLAHPWFWSDQYDHQLQVSGEPALAVHTVTRVLEGDDLLVFYSDAAGKLVGACGWGLTGRMAKELKLARTLVERGASPSAAALADPAVKLKSLLSST
jgi:3-phenylpropionate/trans-cinnamate dioxygenase ferredoxin reductase subunit